MKWPEIRAGLIAFAIVVGMIDGCPIPPANDTPAWERGWIGPIRTVQQYAMKPFGWIGDAVVAHQKFALFVSPKENRFRLTISTQQVAGGPWTPIYRAGDPDHAAYDDQIRYRRMHGTWDPVTDPGPRYHEFAQWIAQRIFADTTAVAVQVRFERIYLDLGAPRDLHVFDFPVEVKR